MGRKYSKKEYRELKKAGKSKVKKNKVKKNNIVKDREILIQEYRDILKQINELDYQRRVS